MGRGDGHHWVLIAFVIGASLGYLIGSGTVEPAQLLNPIGLINDVFAGLGNGG